MDQPSTWIKREFEGILENVQRLGPFKVLLILGPRQVGKSSILLRSAATDAQYINLDDLETRIRAERDPILFSKDFTAPIIVDEIQYAPQLLSPIKVLADKTDKKLCIWLTGSQSFQVMKGVKESLAGRVLILNLFGLSLAERANSAFSSIENFFKEVFIGSFPALRESDPDIWSRYLSSYTTTYIERDVAELLGIQKRREFEIFLKLCALRTGQLVNYDEMGRDAGVSAKTAKDWLGILEDSFVLKLVHPYHSNRSKRLIKTPKMYFLDTGLCSYLAGWRDPEQLRLSPFAGAIFETAIFCEITRCLSNRAKDFQIFYWRTKDGEEIDFLVETNGKIVPIEAKIGTVNTRSLCELENIADKNWSNGTVVSLTRLNQGIISATTEWNIASPEHIYELIR